MLILRKYVDKTSSTGTRTQNSIIQKTFFLGAEYWSICTETRREQRGRTEHLYCDCAPYGMQIRDRRVFSHKWAPPPPPHYRELKGGKTRLRGERDREWEREGEVWLCLRAARARRCALFLFTLRCPVGPLHTFSRSRVRAVFGLAHGRGLPRRCEMYYLLCLV